MKAYTYTESGKLALQEVPRPTAASDSAVMKVQLAAICGTDVRTYRFGSERIRAPRVIGHEVCGVLEEVGPEVEGFRPGDRVTVAPAVGCGTCRWCRKGRTNMCRDLRTVGFDYDGAFAEYMEVPAQALRMGNVTKVPDKVSEVEAVLVEPVACCVNGQEALRITPEDVVVIFGSGFIGCVHAELALAKGARRVIVSDLSEARLEVARRLLPSVQTVSAEREDVLEAIREVADGQGADVIITAAPSGEAHAWAMKIAVPRARISLFGGIPGDGRGYLDSNAIHYGELAVYGAHASTAEQNREVLDRVARRELQLAKYVSATYPLERIEEAFEALKNETMLKVQIRPGR